MQGELDKPDQIVQEWELEATDLFEFKGFEQYQALAHFFFECGRRLSFLEMLEDGLTVSKQLQNIMESSGAKDGIIRNLVLRAMIFSPSTRLQKHTGLLAKPFPWLNHRITSEPSSKRDLRWRICSEKHCKDGSLQNTPTKSCLQWTIKCKEKITKTFW